MSNWIEARPCHRVFAPHPPDGARVAQLPEVVGKTPLPKASFGPQVGVFTFPGYGVPEAVGPGGAVSEECIRRNLISPTFALRFAGEVEVFSRDFKEEGSIGAGIGCLDAPGTGSKSRGPRELATGDSFRVAGSSCDGRVLRSDAGRAPLVLTPRRVERGGHEFRQAP